MAEKARASRDSLQYSLRFYSEARQRVGARFAALSRAWSSDGADKRIVFFGTGEIAEVGYICLHETDLTLVGAIDDQGKTRFFDVPLYSEEWLCENGLTNHRVGYLVVMSFGDVEHIAAQLAGYGVPKDRICWL